MTTSPSNFLKLDEVARILQVDMTTIYRWVKEGTFPDPTRVGPAFKMENGKKKPKRQGIRWEKDLVRAWMKDNAWQGLVNEED